MSSLVNPEVEDITIEQVNGTPPANSNVGNRVNKPQVEIHQDERGNDLPEMPGFDEALDRAESQALDDRKKELDAKQGKKPEKEPEKTIAEKPETTEEPSVAEPAKADPALEVPDSELRVLPHDKESTKRRIEAFLKKESALKAEADTYKSKMAELEKRPAINADEIDKLKSEYEQTKNDLLRYRRRYDIDNDPEINTRFAKPIEEAESNIAATLTKYNVSEGTMKLIKEAGGLANFSRSGKVFKVNKRVLERDPDTGENKEVVRSFENDAGEIVKSWLDAMNPVDAEYARSQLGKQFNLQDERKKFIETETARASEYFSQAEQQKKQQQEEFDKETAEKRSQYKKWADDTITKEEWLKEKEVPANASDDVKKSLQEHNDFVKQARSNIVDPMPIIGTPDAIRATILDAQAAKYLKRENARLLKELEEAKGKAEKAVASTRTTSSKGSLLPRSSAPSAKKETNTSDDFMASFEESLNRLNNQ
jgi:hypothetical protein